MGSSIYIQYLMGVHGVIVDRVEEISNAVAGFSKPDLGQTGAGVDGAKHQACSQQQLGFLLRLIPELIEQTLKVPHIYPSDIPVLTLEVDGSIVVLIGPV